MQENVTTVHWADLTAEKIIKQQGDKEVYTLASGITPSGVVHFGNFRETITVDFVVRALRQRGKKVRFIFSWDDYDTFRKIPKNMPQQELLQNYLYCPIVDTPDPFGQEASYAAHHEKNYERQLANVGVDATPIYQAEKYRQGDYYDLIIKTLQQQDLIRQILNAHRTEPLSDDWVGVSLYCEECNRDRMAALQFNAAENSLHYRCELCGHQGVELLAKSKRVKLPWRLDWPMRWFYEQVDFEPGGKDHSSQGGSYTTAKEIVVKVYGGKIPVYLQYDFVSIKGSGGKMSSSSGELVTIDDVLKIYEPEMVRWIFASYKPNVDFAISFDLDVIKTYEDFDRQERLALGLESGNEKKVAMAKRVYQLSQLSSDALDFQQIFQPSFRHLTNILQIHRGDLSQAYLYYQNQIKTPRDERRFQQRSQCALFWLENYAPEEFKFSLHATPVEIPLISHEQQTFLEHLKKLLQEQWEQVNGSDQQLHEAIYQIINTLQLIPGEIFPLLYQKLIGKNQGPKLAGFILAIGREKVLKLLS